MNKYLFFVLLNLFFISEISFGQFTINKKTNLSIKESSGLLNYNGRIITHNDSGGDPALYEVDSATGNIIRTISITNARNIDWEDLAQDNLYIYIGDFGNNNGNRHNLKIYRISKSDFINTSTGGVLADSILFNYGDQTNFSKATYTTNYDAEAMLIRNDSIYIFTKNWGNFKTYIYSIPKIPGSFQANRIDSLNVGGLITGATYSNSKDTIMLIGYLLSPFVWRCTQFNSDLLSKGVNEKFSLPLSTVQTEGICKNNSNGYFVSSETKNIIPAALYSLEFSTGVSGLKKKDLNKKTSIYPNPTSKFLNIQSDDYSSIEVMDINGNPIIYSTLKNIDVSFLKPGRYLIKINNNQENVIGVESFIID